MNSAEMTPASAWAAPWRPVDAWIAPVVASMALLRVVTVLLTRPGIFPDSKSYRRGFLDFSWTSFVGDSVRPWGVTVWMSLWPTDTVVILAQAVLAALCWTFFAREIWLLCRHGLVARSALVLILLVASLPAIACWDAVITSESVSISSGVLALALLLRALRAQTALSVLWFVVGSLWFALTRPLSLVVVLGWAVAAVVLLLVTRHNRGAWALAAAALVLISGYSFGINQRADDAWTRAYGFSRSTSVYGYNLGWNPVAADAIKVVRATDAPLCMIPEKPSVVTKYGPAYWVGTTSLVCPGMNDWATTHWAPLWRSYLLHHPSQAATILRTQLPTALSPTVYGSYRTGIPLSVQDLFIAQANQPTTPKAGNLLTIPVLAWLSAGLVLLAFGARGQSRRDVAVWVVLLTSAVASFASIAAAVLVIQTPANENGRENVTPTSMIVAASVSLLVLAIDRYATRTRRLPADEGVPDVPAEGATA